MTELQDRCLKVLVEEQNLDIPNSSSNSKNPHFSLAKQKIIQSAVGHLGTVDTIDDHLKSAGGDRCSQCRV